ncbi:MAG TPA: hypothetical protein VFM22_10095 [Castellaniella sp.]|nr:hypothetical protein [Castellaniella sp.]
MIHSPFLRSAGAVVLLLSAIVGLALALYGYFVPLTGVTGTYGALLVIILTIVIALMALGLARLAPGAGRAAWRIVLLILLAGTCFAGFLLHERWLSIAMLAGLIGLIIDVLRPARLSETSHREPA